MHHVRIFNSVLLDDTSDGRHTAPADAAHIPVLERTVCVRIRTRRVVIQGSLTTRSCFAWLPARYFSVRNRVKLMLGVHTLILVQIYAYMVRAYWHLFHAIEGSGCAKTEPVPFHIWQAQRTSEAREKSS